MPIAHCKPGPASIFLSLGSSWSLLLWVSLAHASCALPLTSCCLVAPAPGSSLHLCRWWKRARLSGLPQMWSPATQRGKESWTGSKPHSCNVLPGERRQKWDLGTSQEASPSDGFASQRENTCIYVMVLKRIEADMTKRLFVVNLAGVTLRDYYAILLTSVNF